MEIFINMNMEMVKIEKGEIKLILFNINLKTFVQHFIASLDS